MTGLEGFVYLEIAEAVRRSIVSGELTPGQRLPSVREMAERWHCTPATVARAYARLANEGLVSSRRGRGTRVAVAARPAGQEDVPAEWHWADLVNRAESYLLEVISSGHTPAQAEAALAAAIARWDEMRRELRREEGRRAHSETDERHLRFAGSHDLSVELLSRLLSEASPPVTMSTDFVGSLGGLIALVRGEADVAGVHLWDEATGLYNVPFIERVLPNVSVLVVNLVQREQGLLVPPGNPQALAGLADLAQPGSIFVNRQPGSGTRVWLDAHLKRLGILPRQVAGYDREAYTHLEVAHLIAQGSATVGLGIRAAAEAYGLDFVPLWKERFDLVAQAEQSRRPVFSALLGVLRSAQFRKALAALGGYDLSETGAYTLLG